MVSTISFFLFAACTAAAMPSATEHVDLTVATDSSTFQKEADLLDMMLATIFKGSAQEKEDVKEDMDANHSRSLRGVKKSTTSVKLKELDEKSVVDILENLTRLATRLASFFKKDKKNTVTIKKIVSPILNIAVIVAKPVVDGLVAATKPVISAIASIASVFRIFGKSK